MSVERNLLISLLKLTKKGAVLNEAVNLDAKVPSLTIRKLLEKMQNEGLVYLKEDSVEADSVARLKLAIKAASLGADMEQLSNLLCWQEFEEITAFALQNYGYTVRNNIHFKNTERKFEIDVVGCKKPLVLCIDCKHWQHAITSSALRRIVEAQIERTKSFADSLPNPKLNFECTHWGNAKFFPIILALWPSAFKFYYEVPIVPVLQLQDFLNQLPVYTESLKYFSRSFSGLSHNF